MTSVPARGRQGRNLLTAAAVPGRLTASQGTLWITLLTLTGGVLRFLRLGHQGLWYDEAFTMMLVRHSAGQMLGLIPRTESTPPFYYCVAWLWIRLFGRSAFGLRSLSAIAGTAVIPLGFGAAREILGSRRAGIVCAALVAFNPLLWWYSQEARSYELLVALCAVSLWAFARVLRRPGRRSVALWTVASALALGTHYFAALLVVPEALWLLAVHRRRRAVWAGCGVVAACGLALVPLIATQSSYNHDAWIAHTPMSLRLAQIIPQLLIGTGSPGREVVKFIALALGGCAVVLIAFAPDRIRRAAAVPGGLVLAGAAIAALAIPFGFDEVLTRNLLELWLELAVCASAGLACAPRRWLGAALTAGLCAVGLFAIIGVLRDARLQRPAWPALVRALGARPPAGQARLIVVQRERGLMPLAIYMPDLHWLTASRRLSQIDVVAIHPMHGTGTFCWWGSACNLVSSRLQARYRLRGFVPVGRLRAGQFRVLELRARRPTLLTRPELARALTATRLPRDGLLLQSPGAPPPRG